MESVSDGAHEVDQNKNTTNRVHVMAGVRGIEPRS